MGSTDSGNVPSRADWRAEQLITAGYGSEAPNPDDLETGALVSHMLRAWDASPLDESKRGRALEILSLLLTDVPIPTQSWTDAAREQNDADGTWVPLLVRGAQPGVRVRVPINAYTGEAGMRYNGRLGVVKAVRNGRALIEYDNGDTGNHPPRELEGRF